MNFDEYIEIVKQSAAEDGYDAYYPSLCVMAGSEDRILVLDGELTNGGEEEVAKEWAGSLLSEDDKAYLSYRASDRIIHIDRIEYRQVVERTEILVEPAG